MRTYRSPISFRAWSSLPRESSFSADWRTWSRLTATVKILTATARRPGFRGVPGWVGDHTAIGQAVLRTRPAQPQGLPVLGSPVALVLLEAVGGMSPRHLVEQGVAVDLRDDGCRRDRRRQGIAVNHGQLRGPDARNRHGVHEEEVRRRCERAHGDAHRLEARPQDVPRVDV